MGLGGMPPQKVLKIWASKMAISSILRQISYLFNTNNVCLWTSFCKNKINPRKEGHTGTGPLAPPPPLPPCIHHWGLGKCSYRKFWKFNSREWQFPEFLVMKFGAKWEYMLSGLSPCFGFRWPFECNIVGPNQKQDRFHELWKETGAHLFHIHVVTEHKFGTSWDWQYSYFWTIYFIKHSETKEKRELNRKTGLRHVNQTFEHVSMWKNAEAYDTRSRCVSW